MAWITADRVKETSTTTGTGDFTLDGAASGFKAFGDVCSIGDYVYYAIYQEAAGDFEVGIGILTGATSNLERFGVISSSNSDALVNFGVGGKVVFLTAPAAKLLQQDIFGNLTVPGGDVTLTGADFDTDFSGSIILDAGGSIYLQDSGVTQLSVSNSGVINESDFLWATTAERFATMIPTSDSVVIGPSSSGDWGFIYAGTDDFLHIGNNRAGVSIDIPSSGDFKVTRTLSASLIEADGVSTRLYDNGILSLTTLGSGVSVAGQITASSASISGTVFADALDMNDNEEIKLGTGDDTVIDFDGTNYVHNQIAGNIKFQNNGTDAVIIDSSGIVTPGANGTQDLGSAALRWRDIYTSDLNLSNGIGDYTVVEGEEDLFLYNNKTGKVFKFALIEVKPEEAPPKIKDL